MACRYATVGLVPSILDTVSVSLGPESDLVIDAVAGLNDLDYSVSYKIAGILCIRFEDDYRAINDRRGILRLAEEKISQGQRACVRVEGGIHSLTHAARGHVEY